MGIDLEEKKLKREQKKKAKKEKKEKIMQLIPKKDENGIAYTKQQTRKMVKRVERGLPPIMTSEEEENLKQQEVELKREEEMELAGMMNKGDDSDVDDGGGEEEETEAKKGRTDAKGKDNLTPEEKKFLREEKKRARKEKKKKIMEMIPKRDEDGISYTKQQIRKMVRRVERGLPPIMTPEEEDKLKKQEAELKKEEEMELAGMLYKPNNGSDEDNNEHDDEDGGNAEEDADEEEEGEGAAITSENNGELQSKPVKKRKLSNKPVPSDYVCQACQNKHDFPHWIYDCPDKVTMPGVNQVAAGRHGNNAPSAKKVFVSGLFFDSKPTEVKAMFQSCGKVTSCKLLKFPDTGRCKGQAFVVFDTEEAAKKALKLSGTKISSDETDKKGKKNKTAEKRELELKVSKVVSRAITKGKKD